MCRVHNAEAFIVPIRSDQDGGIKPCSGEPYHLSHAVDLLSRGAPGGNHHNRIGSPGRDVVAAQGRVEGDQGEQKVGRGTGGDQSLVRLSPHSRGAATAHRTDGRNVITLRHRHHKPRAVEAHPANSRIPGSQQMSQRSATGKVCHDDPPALPCVGASQ